jgi:phosphate/sulfate permease
VDAQTIGIAAGIASAGVAAVALLVNWRRAAAQKSRWIASLTIGIVSAVMLMAIIAAFILGDSSDSAQRHEIVEDATPLTEAQYRQQVEQICADAGEKAKRLQQLHTPGTLLGADLKNDEETVNHLKSLRPPPSLKKDHDEIVATWERRNILMESIYSHMREYKNASELTEALAKPSALMEQVGNIFEHLGLAECA